MTSGAQARFDHTSGPAPALSGVYAGAPASLTCDDVRLAVQDDLAPLAASWLRFQERADCTAFQTYEWQSTWQHHIGVREQERPAVVTASDPQGEWLMLLPLAVRPSPAGRELTWHGSDLCDYNGPLLARDYSRRLAPAQSAQLMRRVLAVLRADPRFAHDLVRLEKMTATVGAQLNPLLALPTILHPSGAYRVPVGDDWETFYRARRSSATRQRDRAKRKKLAQFGEVRLIHPSEENDIVDTLNTLIAQKAKTFARMGVSNMFARPGHTEFYRALASDPATRHLVHVSRLQVGDQAAATNLGLTFRDRYYYVLASYGDGEMTRFGPGAAHLRDLMQYASSRGMTTFDLTIGDEAYKLDWAGQDKLYDTVIGVTLRGKLVAAVLHGKAALKRTIKQTPALWEVARRLREVMGKLRG